jgi:hypothetical protein
LYQQNHWKENDTFQRDRKAFSNRCLLLSRAMSFLSLLFEQIEQKWITGIAMPIEMSFSFVIFKNLMNN